MATKGDLDSWVIDILKIKGPSLRYVDIAKEIWISHEKDLRASGELFYTWQYDMRWAANRLRRAGIMKIAEESPAGVWELK